MRPARPVTQQMLLREYAQANQLGRVTSYDALPRGYKGNFNTFSSRRLREMTGTLPAKTTYNEWLRTQSVEFQNDTLGVTKARLYRRGELKLDRFTNRAGDELTLAQLADREAAAFTAAGLDPAAY